MEQEKNHEEEMKAAGRQAADVLRGYGYPDFAREYEQALHRSALDPKGALVHGLVANSTLKQLNTLHTERYANHPAVEKNIQIQERLDTALQKQQGLGVQPSQRIEELSFPSKMYLEENSKPLENAAQEVANYLEEKRTYSHTTEGKTKLQADLDLQLQSYRSLPTSYNMERLETYTQESIGVMRDDFQQAKEALQKENEAYVRERHYLSPEGKAFLLREAEKGEFQMPNQQKGHVVESRVNYAQQQLDQYTKTKEQIFSIDQERTEGPSWKQALLSPAMEKDKPEPDRANVWKTTLEKDYSHLATEQQERYADLQNKILPTEPSKDRGIEMD